MDTKWTPNPLNRKTGRLSRQFPEVIFSPAPTTISGKTIADNELPLLNLLIRRSWFPLFDFVCRDATARGVANAENSDDLFSGFLILAKPEENTV